MTISIYLSPDPSVIVREVNLKISSIFKRSHTFSVYLGEVRGGEVIAGRHQRAQAVHLQQAAVKQGPVLLGLRAVSPFSRQQVVDLQIYFIRHSRLSSNIGR